MGLIFRIFFFSFISLWFIFSNPLSKNDSRLLAPALDASAFRVVTLVIGSDEGAFFIQTPKIGHEEFILNEEETKEKDFEGFRPLQQTKKSRKEKEKESIAAQHLPESSIHRQKQKRHTQAQVQAQATLSEINLDSNIDPSKDFSIPRKSNYLKKQVLLTFKKKKEKE